MSPAHSDIAMAVYYDIVAYLSGNTFHKWGSDMEHLTCCGETTTMFTIKKL